MSLNNDTHTLSTKTEPYIREMAAYLKLTADQEKRLRRRLSIPKTAHFFLHFARKAALSGAEQEAAFSRILVPFGNRKTFVNICLTYPQLFYQDPASVQKHIQSVSDALGVLGLEHETFIKAAAKAPALLYLSPATIQKNITQVVHAFEPKGLSARAYVKAAGLYPTLFYQSPETIVPRVQQMLHLFERNGLSSAAFFKAACRAPALFCLQPQTVEQNVDTVFHLFERVGLTRKAYMKAACQCPSLFYQSSETFRHHAHQVISLFRRFNITRDERETVAFLLKFPLCLAFSTDNLSLRWLYACSEQEQGKVPRPSLLRYKKHQIEKALDLDQNRYVCPFERRFRTWAEQTR